MQQIRRAISLFLLSLGLAMSAQPAQALHTFEKWSNSTKLANPGLLIIDSQSLEIVTENKAETPRIPASVLKLISATAALHFLGPDTTYETSIWRTELSDTFVLRGSLDPWLTSSKYLSNKNGQRYLPQLINKVGADRSKKIEVLYEGLYLQDINELSLKLKSEGKRVTFTKVSKSDSLDFAQEKIFGFASPPLSEMVKHTILWSDNRLANRLGESAAKSIGFKPSAKGLTKTFRLALNEVGVDSLDLIAKDGSGLSKQNAVSARTVVELLVATRTNPRFESLYNGMPVSGKTGTLQKRFINTAPEAIGQVKAKTGWVNNSVTLAGFAYHGEREYVFAILADGIRPTLQSRNAARKAMDKLLGALVKGGH
jgi:D-alanyl-D-alanine carboxypeptidase/D-alanyl-D-alanine-endopeptidase (penicillin-binding protein 4)